MAWRSGSSAWATTAGRCASATTCTSAPTGAWSATGSTPPARAPRPAADPVPEAAEELFASLGAVAERVTLASSGWSGNRIDRLVLADGTALIAKRIVPGSDWLGRCTRDPGREALLFADGVFARMPATVDPAVVAAEPEGEAWWVVMRDVSDELLDESTPLTREENRFVLARAAGMWAQFWDEDVPHLSTLHDRLAFAVPAISEIERENVDILPKQFEAAWEAFGEAVDDDVGTAVLELVDDVTPLSDALAARGTTLIHGDLRDENIAMPGRAARAARLRAGHAGPPRRGAGVVHGPRRLAHRGDARRGGRGLPCRARRARRSGRARARADLAASCSTDGSSATARLCTPTPPNENGPERSSTGGCRACGTRSNSGGEMAGYTIRSLEEIPDVLGRLPGRDADERGERPGHRAGRVHLAADAAAHRR